MFQIAQLVLLRMLMTFQMTPHSEVFIKSSLN